MVKNTRRKGAQIVKVNGRDVAVPKGFTPADVFSGRVSGIPFNQRITIDGIEPTKEKPIIERGKALTSSEAETLSILRKGGFLGRPTENVREILEKEKELAVRKQLTKQAEEKAIQEKVIQEEIEKQPIAKTFPKIEEIQTQQQALTEQEQILRAANLPTERRQAFVQELEQKGDLTTAEKINLFGAKAGAGSFVEERNQLGRTAITTLASVADSLRVAVTGRKALKHLTADAQFQDAIRSIDAAISLVKAGEIDPSQALLGFERAVVAVNQLDSYQRGLGRHNLNYWSNEGNEVETSIIMMKDILQKKRIELIEAENQARRTQAIERLGIQG